MAFAKSKPLIVPVFIPHAGCPHRCVFCDQTAATGRKETFPRIDDVHAAIDGFLSYCRPRSRRVEIAFFGGNFLGLPPARVQGLLDIARTYVDRRLAHGIRFSTRPDTIDPERLEMLRRFPVSTVELGVQSMNDEVLKQSRRGHTSEAVRLAVELLKSQPYCLGLQMMIGLPGQTESHVLETGHQLADMAPDFVRIYPVLVLSGSRLARWYDQGRYQPLSLDDAVQQVKSLYRIFMQAGIAVARMGLQTTCEISPGGAVVAGPFHPAFGELVYSELWLEAICGCMRKEKPRGKTVRLALQARNRSQVVGQKGRNLKQLCALFNLTEIEIDTVADVPLDTVMIDGNLCRLPIQTMP